jgi:hypothetical protein
MLIIAVGFGALTAYGVVTGKTVAFHDLARREQDPSWFRFWMFVNGGSALLAFTLFVAVLALGG